MIDIAANLAELWERIAAAARRAGRRPERITLIAVSKTVEPARIEAALEAGVEALGENRVQEAEEKIPKVAGNARWHLIGTLQSNKARLAAALFDAVHSVDRSTVLRRLAAAAAARERPLKVYVQVQPAAGRGSVDERFAAALELCRVAAAEPMLDLRGLMIMPPYDPDPERARPHFQGLRTLRDRLVEADGELRLPELSMGMSGDYEVAIEEGATILRIGTAIFGARP